LQAVFKKVDLLEKTTELIINAAKMQQPVLMMSAMQQPVLMMSAMQQYLNLAYIDADNVQNNY
jgi:hypothetical protein